MAIQAVSIDGSQGEGGGQILRSALSLSLLTGRPFEIKNIRARRAKPGLLRQHLTAVNSAAKIGHAEVRGAALGSMELRFVPGAVQPGDYHFAVGTAGSATLVLQTVLPPLLTAAAPSTVVVEGGTHNPLAPPFDFLAKAFLPLINRMGPRVAATLIRHGFYPAGGGEFRVEIVPALKLTPLDITERGEIQSKRAVARVSGLHREIAERELAAVGKALNLSRENLILEELAKSHGPGNVVLIEIQSQHVTEIFTGFGEKGVSAETVAGRAFVPALDYIDSGATVCAHLADQLLLPFAMAGGGKFSTLPLSSHSLSNLDVLRQFLNVDIKIEKVAAQRWNITLCSQ